jgi:hypothetical protein
MQKPGFSLVEKRCLSLKYCLCTVALLGENTMQKDYSITMFYCVKTFVCLAATVYATVTGLDGTMLATVGFLSMLAIPLFAWLESK